MKVKDKHCEPMRSGRGNGPYYVFAKPMPQRSFWGSFWNSVWNGVCAVFAAVWHCVVIVLAALWRVVNFLATILMVISIMTVINDILFGRRSRD